MSRFKRDKPVHRELKPNEDAALEADIRKRYGFGTPLNREARRRQQGKVARIKKKLDVKVASNLKSIKVVAPDDPEFFREDS